MDSAVATRVQRTVAVAVLAGLAFGLLATGLWRTLLDPDALRASIAPAGPAAPPAFLAVYVLGTVALVPGTILTIVGALLFPLAEAVALIEVGSVVGATCAFLLARTGGRDLVARRLRGHAARWDALAAKNGLALVLYLRLVPFFPFNVLNYALGLSGVTLGAYVAGTAVGVFPGVVTFVYFTQAAIRLRAVSDLLREEFLVPAILFAIVAAAPLVYRKYRAASEPAYPF